VIFLFPTGWQETHLPIG